MARVVEEFATHSAVGDAEIAVVAAFAVVGIASPKIVVEVVALVPILDFDVASNLHYMC